MNCIIIDLFKKLKETGIDVHMVTRIEFIFYLAAQYAKHYIQLEKLLGTKGIIDLKLSNPFNYTKYANENFNKRACLLEISESECTLEKKELCKRVEEAAKLLPTLIELRKAIDFSRLEFECIKEWSDLLTAIQDPNQRTKLNEKFKDADTQTRFIALITNFNNDFKGFIENGTKPEFWGIKLAERVAMIYFAKKIRFKDFDIYGELPESWKQIVDYMYWYSFDEK